MPSEWIDSLLPYGNLRTFPQKGEIISIQEQVDWFGVILAGRARTMQMFVNGDFSLMETLHPGYVLGMDLICTKTRKSPYCAAADVPTQVLMFPSWVILKPGAFPEPERMVVWQNLLTMLSQENMRKYNRLAVLSQRGMRDRILTFLSYNKICRQFLECICLVHSKGQQAVRYPWYNSCRTVGQVLVFPVEP